MKAIYSIIGFFVFIVFIIFAIFLSGNLSNDTTPAPAQNAIKLADYSNSTSFVTLTMTGPVTANEKHYSARIKIDGTQRTIDIFKGYEQNVFKSKSYPNNPKAYEAFLQALDGIRYSAERSTEKDSQNNESTACYNGIKYGLDLHSEATKNVFHRWSSNCSGARGTFGGDMSKVLDIFKSQITDYSELVTGTSFY